jgi:hypothetical protein
VVKPLSKKHKTEGDKMEPLGLLYEDRFLESWAGSIITNPSTAIVELVANAWDAYSTRVDITLPDANANILFSIADNGKGMTLDEFRYIWRAMSYDRITKFGPTTEPPLGITGLPRPVFGKNGKGRFASFCFAPEYVITSRKEGQQFTVKVSRTPSNPLVLEEIEHLVEGVKGHGTVISGAGEIPYVPLSVEQARNQLGSRFLTNPALLIRKTTHLRKFRLFSTNLTEPLSHLPSSRLTLGKLTTPL